MFRLANTGRVRCRRSVHHLGEAFIDEVHNELAGPFRIPRTVLRRAVLAITGSKDHQRWIIAEDIEERERRRVYLAVFVQRRHPCDRPRYYQSGKNGIGAVGVSAQQVEFHGEKLARKGSSRNPIRPLGTSTRFRQRRLTMRATRRTKITGEIIDRRTSDPIRDEEFASIDYLETRFWGCRYEECVWTRCTFRRVTMGHGMEFNSCRFVDCKFLTAHTNLRATFKNCTFENCEFSGTSTWGLVLEDCKISGSMKNMIFFGKKSQEKDQAILRQVDLTGVTFDMTDFRLKMDLSTVKFATNPGTLLVENESWTKA